MKIASWIRASMAKPDDDVDHLYFAENPEDGPALVRVSLCADEFDGPETWHVEEWKDGHADVAAPWVADGWVLIVPFPPEAPPDEAPKPAAAGDAPDLFDDLFDFDGVEAR